MAYIPEGYIVFARQTLTSEIFFNKPSWWFKVWFYILSKVNHSDNRLFKRGSNFFSYNMIYEECNLARERVDTKAIYKLLKYLKRSTALTIVKSTRGIVLSVCNYDKYQNPKNYTRFVNLYH